MINETRAYIRRSNVIESTIYKPNEVYEGREEEHACSYWKENTK